MNEAESSGTREVSGGEEAAVMTSVLAQMPSSAPWNAAQPAHVPGSTWALFLK